MALKYLIPNLTMKNVKFRKFFVYPDGKQTITAFIEKETDMIRLMKEIYTMDLYTANDNIEYVPKDVQHSELMTVNQVKEYFLLNNIEYYAQWIVAIDKIIRYYNLNVADAIKFQLNINRQDLYNLLDKKENELFNKIIL